MNKLSNQQESKIDKLLTQNSAIEPCNDGFAQKIINQAKSIPMVQNLFYKPIITATCASVATFMLSVYIGFSYPQIVDSNDFVLAQTEYSEFPDILEYFELIETTNNWEIF